jgi:hypothetical protein
MMKNAQKSGGKSKGPAGGNKPAKAGGKGSSTKSSKASSTTSSKSTKTYREHSSVPDEAITKVTTDHDEIRRWGEERGAVPAIVRGTGGDGDIGLLRLDFPGYSGEGSLEEVSWDEWFEKFDERQLALLFQEKTASGEKSNFHKIISRDTAEEATKRPKTRKAGG